jgi:hypothetical protein
MPNTSLVNRRQAAQLRKYAKLLMEQGEEAIENNDLVQAHLLFGDAIARLQLLWSGTCTRQYGDLFAKALDRGAYPAQKLFFDEKLSESARRTWQALGFERERNSADLRMLLTCVLRPRPEKYVVSVLFSLHNLAADLLHYGYDPNDVRHYLDLGYTLSYNYWPDIPMHSAALSAFKSLEARYFKRKGELHRALEFAKEAVAAEQRQVDLQAKRRLPPPPVAWRQNAQALQNEIEQAITAAA